MVTVGDPGHAAYIHAGYLAGRGAVAYEYKIGKYEVTRDQLYDYDTGAGNALDGSALPATFMDRNEWGEFCDWLTDGSSADAGYYADGSALSHDAWVAIHGATYFIPTHDEWIKAAFYDPDKGGAGPGYWLYPTQNDTVPTGVTTPSGINSANWLPAYNYSIDVGSYTSSFSHYGAFDMAGNMWELVSPTGLLSTEASIRGASFHSKDATLDGARPDYERTPYYSGGNAEAGFRVVLVEAAGASAGTAIVIK